MFLIKIARPNNDNKANDDAVMDADKMVAKQICTNHFDDAEWNNYNDS